MPAKQSNDPRPETLDPIGPLESFSDALPINQNNNRISVGNRSSCQLYIHLPDIVVEENRATRINVLHIKKDSIHG